MFNLGGTLRENIQRNVVEYINECFSEEYGKKIMEAYPNLVKDMMEDVLENSGILSDGYYSSTDMAYAMSRALFPKVVNN